MEWTCRICVNKIVNQLLGDVPRRSAESTADQVFISVRWILLKRCWSPSQSMTGLHIRILNITRAAYTQSTACIWYVVPAAAAAIHARAKARALRKLQHHELLGISGDSVGTRTATRDHHRRCAAPCRQLGRHVFGEVSSLRATDRYIVIGAIHNWGHWRSPGGPRDSDDRRRLLAVM